MLGECLKELEESHDQHAVLGEFNYENQILFRIYILRLQVLSWFFFSFFQFSNLLWRPSSSSTPQSERANLLSGTRGRANFLTLKTNLHHFPQPLLHLPHLHLWTHSFQENLPPCTSLPIFHLTHKNSSDLLVSSEDFCKIGCSPLFFWFVADLSFFQKPTALCWTRSCDSPPLTWLMDPLQSWLITLGSSTSMLRGSQWDFINLVIQYISLFS